MATASQQPDLSSLRSRLLQDPPGEQPGEAPGRTLRPSVLRPGDRGSGKLRGKAVLITGGDTSIDRATVVLFAREGADVAIVYRNHREDESAEITAAMVTYEGRRCLVFRGDLADAKFREQVVHEVFASFHRLDILVDTDQLQRTSRASLYKLFFASSDRDVPRHRTEAPRTPPT